MRNRRIFKILASSAAGLASLTLFAWSTRTPAARSDEAATISAAGLLSSLGPPPPGGSLDEARLEAAAHRTAAAAAAHRLADHFPDGRVLRQRASRSEATRTPAPTPAPAPSPAPGDADELWAKLRHCEAGGDYTRNSGNGYYGAYQFSAGTWHGLGYPGLPHQAPPQVQDEAARKLQRRSGWGQWPACSRRVGAR
jgi:hypothetical protein